MRDYVAIGPGPLDEEVAQLGTDEYYERAMGELRRFRDLILAKFGPPPKGASIRIKGFQHDFGTYYELVVYYDDDIEDSQNYAYAIEANTPATWHDTRTVP